MVANYDLFPTLLSYLGLQSKTPNEPDLPGHGEPCSRDGFPDLPWKWEMEMMEALLARISHQRVGRNEQLQRLGELRSPDTRWFRHKVFARCCPVALLRHVFRRPDGLFDQERPGSEGPRHRHSRPRRTAGPLRQPDPGVAGRLSFRGLFGGIRAGPNGAGSERWMSSRPQLVRSNLNWAAGVGRKTLLRCGSPRSTNGSYRGPRRSLALSRSDRSAGHPRNGNAPTSDHGGD